MAEQREHKRQRQQTDEKQHTIVPFTPEEIGTLIDINERHKHKQLQKQLPDKTLFILVSDSGVESVLLETDHDTGRKFRQAFQETKKNNIDQHIALSGLFDKALDTVSRDSDSDQTVMYSPESPFVWNAEYFGIDGQQNESECNPILEWIPDLAEKTWQITNLNDDPLEEIWTVLCQTSYLC